MNTHCTRHLSCRIIQVRKLNGYAVEKNGSRGPYYVVMSDAGELGSFQFKTQRCWDGAFLIELQAFGGGEMISGERLDKRDEPAPQEGEIRRGVKLVEAHARRFAGSWRMALHG